MKLIFNFVRKYFDKMILLLIVIVITTIIVAFYPWLFGKLVDALFYEPTSALDAKTEQEIVKVWEQLYQNKTVIVIAHRFSTISRLDKVIYLDKGRIVGCDEHQKLLKNCPEYNRWLEKQIEEGV